QQSIVLLRNENKTLPLKKSVKKIAVIGPNANNKISVLGNYNGVPSHVVTLLEGIKEKLGKDVEVVYEKAINFTNDTLIAYTNIIDSYTWEGKQGFKAEYYNNKDLKGDPVLTKTENNIDHSWQRGDILGNNLTATNFSARYTTTLTAKENGSITFEVEGNDGYRLLINGKEVLNAWLRNRWGAKSYKLETQKDTVYKIELEYWQGDDDANVALRTGNLVV